MVGGAGLPTEPFDGGARLEFLHALADRLWSHLHPSVALGNVADPVPGLFYYIIYKGGDCLGPTPLQGMVQ